MGSEPKSENAFNAASQNSGKAMALLIDFQLGCVVHLQPDDARAYLDHMATMLQDLRARDVPIGWVTIGVDESILKEPKSGNRNSRSFAELEDMHFFKLAEDHESVQKRMYIDFIKIHGPRENELLFLKDSFGALDTSADAKGSKDTLKGYLEKEGVTHVILSGGMAAICVAHTARDCLKAGIKTTVAIDGVIGQKHAPNRMDFDYTDITWKGGEHIDHVKHGTGIDSASKIEFTKHGVEVEAPLPRGGEISCGKFL